MLRDVQLTPSGRTPVGKWAAMVAIMAASVALVGLKPPPNRAIAQDTAAKPGAQISTTQVEYDLRYFSDEGGMLIAARPAELLASNSMSEIAKLKLIRELPAMSKMTESLGVEIQDIQQVIVAFESFERMPPMPTSFCVRALKPLGKLSDIVPGGRSFTLAGAETLEVPPQGGTCLWKPDDRTLVFGSKRNVERWIQGREVERNLTESELWKKLKDRPLLVLSEGKLLGNVRLPIQLRPNGAAPMLISSILSPILDESGALGLAASMDKEWNFVAMAKSKDAKGVSIIQETSQAGMVIMKNGLRELKWTLKSQPQTPSAPSDSKNALEVLLSAGTKLAEAAKVQTDGGTVSVTTSIPLSEVPISTIVSAFMATRKAADRSQSANNLKQIALAFHQFESANKKFPHSTKSPDPSHMHPVSWRVMILPFMEQKALYNLYRFDEPWDGPNNSKLLSMVPIQYRHPEAPAGSTNTPYLAITGEEAMFQPSKDTLPSDVRDGLARTLMVVESKSTIPWTKPDDLAYASDKPLPSIGGFSGEGFHAAFGDGSVRFISKTIAESVLRALMTARGGEPDVNQ